MDSDLDRLPNASIRAVDARVSSSIPTVYQALSPNSTVTAHWLGRGHEAICLPIRSP